MSNVNFSSSHRRYYKPSIIVHLGISVTVGDLVLMMVDVHAGCSPRSLLEASALRMAVLIGNGLKIYTHIWRYYKCSGSTLILDSTKFDVAVFIRECINDVTLKTLKHLNISGSDKITAIKALSQFSSLESLSVSGRPICQAALSVVRFLPRLKILDISNTCIADISSLTGLKNLQALFMHNLRIRSGCVTKTFQSLTGLRVLDISKEVTDYGSDRCLPGILSTPLDGHSYIVPVSRNVQIINCATRSQAVMALNEYWNTDRDAFTAHALHCVYYMLQSSYDDFSREEVGSCIRVVCDAMKKHLQNLGVQMAGSACLYHLCK
uniref:Leucine-rich repeat-containing protein 29 n=1 Tax=Heterorhabditis bacteriophora TaxID=37862 RepID=A0A1I7WXH6_HETBA